jgi:hypothetical protein
MTKEQLPSPSEWQEVVLKRLEMDICSGAAWHPAVSKVVGGPKSIFEVGVRPKEDDQNSKIITPIRPKASDILEEVLLEVCTWFVKSSRACIPSKQPDTRIGIDDIETVLKQMVIEAYPGNPLIEKNAGKLASAAVWGSPSDPRKAIGVWSGASYPVPNNPSPRLFRNGIWDLNSWTIPAFRQHKEAPDYGALDPFMRFAIPEGAQREMLLDWIGWCLQNEADKPGWSVLLFSEEKGTGKSTIGVVLEALFGKENTAKLEGVDKIIAKHNDQVLSKKLIVAEEVHISSQSTNGNKLKDLITADRTTVEPKYQPTKTVPLKACFLFTTNHRPLWLEGGERRYYIIQMSHDGHAQGERSEEFGKLVEEVFKQVGNPKQLASLYSALMQRKLSQNFSPQNLRFNENATSIMRELQAQSGHEGDETLEQLLAQHDVEIIPSADLQMLINYTRMRNANALRNALIRLGWESRRVRLGGPQVRIWVKKDLVMENGRVSSITLSRKLPEAVENGYVWWPCEAYLQRTWQMLIWEKLNPQSKPKGEYSAVNQKDEDELHLGEGPWLTSGEKIGDYQVYWNDKKIKENNIFLS